jgi:hypothetical protein
MGKLSGQEAGFWGTTGAGAETLTEVSYEMPSETHFSLELSKV